MNKIENAINQLEKSAVKYLDSNQRHLLLNDFTLKERFYLILNTLYQNKRVWQDSKYNYELLRTIKNCIDYVESKKEKQSFLDENSKWSAFYHNRISENLLELAYCGFSITKLGEEFLSGFLESNDEIGVDSDSEDWSSLFYGSLVYAHAVYDFDDIDVNRNRDYWHQFIINVKNKRVSFHENIIIPELKQENLKLRKQESDFSGNGILKLTLEKIQNSLKAIQNKYNSNTISVKYIIVSNAVNFKCFINGDEIKGKDAYLLSLELNLESLFTTLKSQMYECNKEEGAWLSCDVTMDNSDVTYQFNYDTYEPFFDKFLDPIHFKEELENYSRNKDFTPQWLLKATK